MTTLAAAKQHLRVSDDEDDQLIEHLIDAAQGYIEKHLGAAMPDPAPAPIEAATLLLVGDLYENRERQQSVTLYRNPTFELLLRPYRDLELP